MCGGGGGDDTYARLAREDELARQARIKEGMASIDKGFKGFDDAFFAKRARAYTNYATPQVVDQYGKQQENLAYNLARSGLTASSEASRNAGELQRQYNLAKSTIAGEALNQSNRARQDVESNRADLIAQLNATGDARAAANATISRANSMMQDQGFSPIGNLFQATTGLLGNAAQAGYYDRNAPGLGAYGINQPGRQNSGASRVVR